MDEHEPRHPPSIPLRGRTYNRRMLGNVLTAIVTPFHEDGSIDFDAFQALARHLVEHGSDGIVVAGTTGESPTLSDDERLDLLPRRERGGRRHAHGRRRHRHLLDVPLGAPDRAGARARCRRAARRDAVLQQAAAARDRRAFRGDRARERRADRRLQHPEPRRDQHRAGDDHAAGRDRDRARGEAGERRPRPGAAHRRDGPRPLRGRRQPDPAVPRAGRRSAASACTPMSSARRSPSRCARRSTATSTAAASSTASSAPPTSCCRSRRTRSRSRRRSTCSATRSAAIACRSCRRPRTRSRRVRACLERLGLLVVHYPPGLGHLHSDAYGRCPARDPARRARRSGQEHDRLRDRRRPDRRRRGHVVPARRASRRRPDPPGLRVPARQADPCRGAHARARGSRRRAAVPDARGARRGDLGDAADARARQVEARRARAPARRRAARGRSGGRRRSTSGRSGSSSSAWRTPCPTASASRSRRAPGRVFHTGDWKLDHTPVDGLRTDVGRLAELGNRGVDLLLGDSTNAERPGLHPLRARRRRGVPPDHPAAPRPRAGLQLRVEHPPHAAGDRRRVDTRPQGRRRRPFDAPQHERRAQPRLRERAGRHARQARRPRRRAAAASS